MGQAVVWVLHLVNGSPAPSLAAALMALALLFTVRRWALCCSHTTHGDSACDAALVPLQPGPTKQSSTAPRNMHPYPRVPYVPTQIFL